MLFFVDTILNFASIYFHSDDSLGYEFPFILRAVSEGGRICALCPWSKFCRGCEIPCNDCPLLQGMLTHSSKSINQPRIVRHIENNLTIRILYS